MILALLDFLTVPIVRFRVKKLWDTTHSSPGPLQAYGSRAQSQHRCRTRRRKRLGLGYPPIGTRILARSRRLVRAGDPIGAVWEIERELRRDPREDWRISTLNAFYQV